MTLSEFIAKLDRHFRKEISRLPPDIVISIYSQGRKYFLSHLVQSVPKKLIEIPEEKEKTLWGIKFRCGLFNAAGIFKNGQGYELAAMQGAGAFIAGTSTDIPRKGNEKYDIVHPFAPYPRSKSASNWMGLPNDGHEVIAKRLSKINRVPNCPVGISLSISPELTKKKALEGLIDGIEIFDKAGVDFIEINESCPNISDAHHSSDANTLDEELISRLEYIHKRYIKSSNRHIPIILKFSTDTNIALLPGLLDALFTLGFDGINLGNTSIEYDSIRESIAKSELKLFDYFVKTYGGGISGKPLKSKSLELASFAAKYIADHPPAQEFHVIRTGGIDSKQDLADSGSAEISLNQWFTGYFENFGKYGHKVYKKIIK